MISVAIPTFSRPALLVEALESVLAQTLPADEIVVSDNASPDDTCARVEALARRHGSLRLVRQQRNVGGVANWNAAVASTRGDLVALCFDDDLWEADHLERSVAALRERPGTAMVHGWFRTLATQADGRAELVEGPRRPASSAAGPRDALFHLIQNYSWPFHPSSLVFRRELFDRTGPFDPAWQLADTDWWLRASFHGRIDFLPEFHLIDRRHGQNWSNDVGAVSMSREVNRMARAHLGRMRGGATGALEVAALARLWSAHQSVFAARLLVARGRAGAGEACAGSLRLLLDEVPAGAWVPQRTVDAAGRLAAGALSRLQRCLPGGSAYYSGVGVSMPR